MITKALLQLKAEEWNITEEEVESILLNQQEIHVKCALANWLIEEKMHIITNRINQITFLNYIKDDIILDIEYIAEAGEDGEWYGALRTSDGEWYEAVASHYDELPIWFREMISEHIPELMRYNMHN